jgi:translation initiation factor IF-1
VSKEDCIRTEGKVTELLPNTMFKVVLENKITIIAYLGGKLKQHKINILLGDKVDVELSPYDMTRGRIVYRK